MKELTRIPNRRDAVLYKDVLCRELERNDISFDDPIEVHHTAQFSEVVIFVFEKDFDKAEGVMKAVIKKGPPKDYKSIHFQHDVTIYVPCYQKNPKNENDGYPTFTYNLAEASSDEQLAASFEPDYILKLTGKFDAKTKPFKKDAI